MLYVSFRSKLKPITFRCVAMGSVVYFEGQIAHIFRSEQSEQIVLSGFVRLLYFVQAKS